MGEELDSTYERLAVGRNKFHMYEMKFDTAIVFPMARLLYMAIV